MFEGLGIFVLVVVAVVVFYLLRAIRMVPQGYNYTVERFGRYVRTLQPGLGLIVPFIDRIGAKQNMMEQVLDIPSQEVITRDNAMVKVDGIAFYQIVDAPRAAYEVRDLEQRHHQPGDDQHPHRDGLAWISTISCRSATRSTSACCSVVDQATQPWGVKMNRIEIKDIAPPRDLVESMARQMKAERDKRAAILEAEGLRQAAILQGRGREAVGGARGRRPPRSRLPRCRGARALCRGRSQGHRNGVATPSPRETCRRSTISWPTTTSRRSRRLPPRPTRRF